MGQVGNLKDDNKDINLSGFRDIHICMLCVNHSDVFLYHPLLCIVGNFRSLRNQDHYSAQKINIVSV